MEDNMLIESQIQPSTNPQRPPLLSAIFRRQNHHEIESDETYRRFLRLAEQTHTSLFQTPVDIKTSFKFSIASMPSSKPFSYSLPLSPVTLPNVDANAMPTSATDVTPNLSGVNSSPNRDKKDQLIMGEALMNSSLNCIFIFYAQLQQVYTSTFSAADLQNETMNLLELIVMCKDFKIIPKLLTQREVKYLFRMLQTEKAQGKLDGLIPFTNEPYNKMPFDDFKDFVVRMALFAYNKPGLKRYILSVDGFLPTPEDTVGHLSHYLHLDDEKYVKNFINTVGRETQGNLNFRSISDESRNLNDGQLQMMVDMRNSLHKDPKSHDKPKITKTMKNEGGISSNESDNIKNRIEIDGSKSVIPPIGKRVLPKKISILSPSKSRLPSELVQMLYPETKADESDARSDTMSTSSNRSGNQDFKTNSPIKDRSTEQSTLLNQLVDGDSSDDEEENVKMETHKSPSSPSKIPDQQNNQSASSLKKSESFIGRSHKRNNDMKDVVVKEKNRYTLKIVDKSQTNSSSTSKFEELPGYDKKLSKLLNRYAYIAAPRISSDITESEAAFIDMGVLAASAECVVRINITNTSKDDIFIDVTCRGFQSENARVTTLPGRLIPGLTRHVSISFTVEPGLKNVLGSIDVTGATQRTGEHFCVSCPAFYRVGKTQSEKNQNLCTLRNLTTFLNEKCGFLQPLSVTFERKTKNDRPQSSPGTRKSTLMTSNMK